MAHRRNEDFYLYTGLCVDNGDCYNALVHLRALDPTVFKFKHLHYGEPAQHADLFNSLKSWGPDLDDLAFPCVIYTKVNDFEDNPNREPAFVKGYNNIANTDWLALYTFEGPPAPPANTANTETANT